MAWELSLIQPTTGSIFLYQYCSWSADAVRVISRGNTQEDSLCSKEVNSGISPTLLLLSYEQSEKAVRRWRVADECHLLFSWWFAFCSFGKSELFLLGWSEAITLDHPSSSSFLICILLLVCLLSVLNSLLARWVTLVLIIPFKKVGQLSIESELEKKSKISFII